MWFYVNIVEDSERWFLEEVVQKHPDLDSSKLDDYIHIQMQQLAVKYSSKFNTSLILWRGKELFNSSPKHGSSNIIQDKILFIFRSSFSKKKSHEGKPLSLNQSDSLLRSWTLIQQFSMCKRQPLVSSTYLDSDVAL